MKYVLDCVSDTHTLHDDIVFPPHGLEGDVVWILVHAGDFTHNGRANEIAEFEAWFRQQPHPHKVWVYGNHERFTDADWVARRRKLMAQEVVAAEVLGDNQRLANAKKWLNELKTVTSMVTPYAQHLHDSGCEIQGLKFYGSPYTPEFHDWGYQLEPEDAETKWQEIPEGVDVVVVHGPPKWHGDRTQAFKDPDKLVFVGDVDLLTHLRRVRPRLVVCGHIHEGYGTYHDQESGVVVVNAAYMRLKPDPYTRGRKYEPRGEFQRVVIDGNTVTVTSTPIAE